MQKLINIWFSKYLKRLNLTTSPRHLTQNKPNVNKAKGKNGRVYPVNPVNISG